MSQNTAQPGLMDMFSQFNTFQQDAMKKMTASMTDLFGHKNPMAAFYSGKNVDNPIVSGMSEYLDVMQKGVKGMIDMTEVMMPMMTKNDMASFSAFVESLPEMPGKIIKKILEIPPVGLTRPYQEKINNALDKWAMFNTAAMEFMATTFVPLEEATRMTLKEIVKQTEAIKTPEDAQKIYEKWLKIMENEYQALFKTDRYKHVIAKIFSAMGEFRAASRELILDMIHLAGLPFGREVDELCKDVFDLKKKIKVLEAQIKKMEEGVVH